MRLPSRITQRPQEVNVRLYGGWFDDQGLSRDGTRLSQEVGQSFPLSLVGLDGKMRYVRCEIASSLVDCRADYSPPLSGICSWPEWYLRDPLRAGALTNRTVQSRS